METTEKGQVFNCHSKNWPQYHACLSVHLEQYIIIKMTQKLFFTYAAPGIDGERRGEWVGKGIQRKKEQFPGFKRNAWVDTPYQLPPILSGSIVIVSFALCCFDFAGPRFERTKALLFITSVVLNFVYNSLVLNGSGSVRDHISDLRRDGINLTSNVPLDTIPQKNEKYFSS